MYLCLLNDGITDMYHYAVFIIVRFGKGREFVEG
jgi:hypothetical protein